MLCICLCVFLFVCLFPSLSVCKSSFLSVCFSVGFVCLQTAALRNNNNFEPLCRLRATHDTGLPCHSAVAVVAALVLTGLPTSYGSARSPTRDVTRDVHSAKQTRLCPVRVLVNISNLLSTGTR